MTHELWTVALLLVLAVVAALAAVVAGLWTLGLSAAILLLLVVRVLTVQQGGWWWRWSAVPLGLLGGLVGMASALTALVAVGEVAGAGERVGWGWAALVLAALAAAGATVARARPRLACAALIAGSSLGMAAMSLFDINTFYVAAVPLCWIAAALALLGARPPDVREAAQV
jgi:hypothetical protein